MAQRDYEEQPEAPDLGASVQLESDQQLVAPPGDRDGLDAGYVPADRPYVLDEDGVTARGMREGDTLDRRLRRERREEPVDPDRAGRLRVAGEGAALERPDAMDGVDVGIDGGAASAEEAAVHEIDDLAGAPIEVEPSLADSPALDDAELDDALSGDPLAERARQEAARDVREDGAVFDPGSGPLDESGETVGGGSAHTGGGWTGRGPDPALPRDPADRDPAAGIDANREVGGAAAPASGRGDVGPDAGLP
ncbi:MAG: hypothetical protein JWR58_5369 [Pseudonocardia sp.]|jgi:hypothetical protein|nr:hypothetical protein [Pseudonocardia sp.]